MTLNCMHLVYPVTNQNLLHIHLKSWEPLEVWWVLERSSFVVELWKDILNALGLSKENARKMSNALRPMEGQNGALEVEQRIATHMSKGF